MIGDSIKAYADTARVIALSVVAVLLIVALFRGGVSVGKGQSARAIAGLQAKLAGKDRALSDASHALRSSASALRAVNAEAARRIAAAAQAQDQAKLAGVVAAAAKTAADKRMAAFDAEIGRARERPTCRALLNTDRRAVCGF